MHQFPQINRFSIGGNHDPLAAAHRALADYYPLVKESDHAVITLHPLTLRDYEGIVST